MFLIGEKIYLRAIEPLDVDLIYNWENNMEIWSVSFTQIPFSKFVVEEFVNSAHQDIFTNKQLRLMICDVKTDQPVGVSDLFDFEPQHQRGGLGIYIHKDFRNLGLANESILLMKEYCFKTLHLKQIYAHININNIPSQKLFERAGFEKNALKKCWHKTGFDTFEDVWFLQCIQ